MFLKVHQYQTLADGSISELHDIADALLLNPDRIIDVQSTSNGKEWIGSTIEYVSTNGFPRQYHVRETLDLIQDLLEQIKKA